MSIEAYPLCWPDGWPRTENPEYSMFSVTQNTAQDLMYDEIRKLGGTDIVLSTNLRLRLDGMPYSAQRQPEDKGVAVYFNYKDRSMAFACDKYLQLGDNIHAIGKTIGALRGIERWGASDMIERAFTGFAALEHNESDSWKDILQVGTTFTLDECERNYRLLAKAAHPDRGGTEKEMQNLNWAREQARAALKL